jgi:hypothetical protein
VFSNPQNLFVLNTFLRGFNLKVLLVFMLILSSALANIAKGDSNEPNFVKWSQPPVEWQEPNTYIGWDEPSFLDEAYYARWIMVGEPDCWTYNFPYQCYGDADGLKEGNSKIGYYYVGTNDLSILQSCLSLPPGIPYDGCACSDFDRDGDVDDDDAAIQESWFQVQDIPCDCPRLFGPVLAADDFPCDSNKPITAIRWWGSFNNWRDNAIPSGNLPYAFHITIWIDVPAGTDANYSHPGKIVWENYCDTYDVSFFGTEFDPRIQQTDLTKFEFYQELAPNDYWYQPTDANTYWLGIMALYNSEPNFAWGWETRPHFYNDSAVRFFGKPEPDTNYPSDMFEPVEHDGNSWDLSFELISNPKNLTDPNMDLGDAPDSTNNFGVEMFAYSSPHVNAKANYPTVYMTGSPPYGPIHWQPNAVAYLGNSVSLEAEADIGLDSDGRNNIIPNYDLSDLDNADDGVLNMPLFMNHYPGQAFWYQVTVVTPNVPLYVNAWFDWNGDGDWEDVLDWCGNPAPEWIIQNQTLTFNTPGVYTVKSSPFTPWQPREDPVSILGLLWMRITLSEQPWTGSGVAGSGPANGYQFGETEDYHFAPLFPIYCLGLAHPDSCEWIEVGTPACWCFLRQCHGDADGQLSGSPKTGFYYVGPNDIGILVSAWLVKEPPFGPGIASVPYGICADFAHDQGGSAKTGFYRVGPTDLNILIENWLVLEPNFGPGVPPDCMH